MANKLYNIRFLFPKVKAAYAEQFVSIAAGNLGMAVNRGFAQVKTRKGVKGARISEGKITFTTEELDKTE